MEGEETGRGGDRDWEGGRGGWSLPLTLRMHVTQCFLPHVAHPDGAFAAAVHKLVAVDGMEDGGCDHLSQLLHVGGLNIHHIFKRGQGSNSTGHPTKRGMGMEGY